MIFYGTSGAQNLKAMDLPGHNCQSCGAQNSMQAVIYSRYAHLYWIPLFSLGKKKALHCKECGSQPPRDQFSLEIQNKFRDFSRDYKIPVWHFFGVIAIATLVLGFVYANSQQDKKTDNYLANPQAGDVYEIRVDGDYSLFRIIEVQTDSVVVNYSDYVATTKGKLKELYDESRYAADFYILPKEALVSIADEEDLIRIVRE